MASNTQRENAPETATPESVPTAWFEDPDWAQRLLETTRRLLALRFHRLGKVIDSVTELATEMTQAAFLALLQQPDGPSGFESERHALNWLVLVGYRRGVDWLRRTHPVPSSEVLDAQPGSETSATPGLVWQCLQRLPDEERLVLLRSAYENRTDVEIGRELYGTEGTDSAKGQRARNLRLRAQRHLGELLRQDGFSPEDWP